MATKITVTGLKEVIQDLEKVNANTDGILKGAVSSGINVVADSMRDRIGELKADNVRYAPPGKTRTMTKREKEGLLESMGRTKVRSDGTVYDAKAGVQGYNKQQTPKYPNGIPNVVLYDAIDAGTSFRVKQPISRPVKNASQGKAIEAMQDSFEDAIKRFLGN